MNPEEGITFKVLYYCNKRKAQFHRKATIDDDLSIKRKLNAATLQTINQQDGIVSLLVQRINNQLINSRGSGASLPAYLFGPEYFKARRNDPANIWDLRKAAFTPLVKDKKEAEA